MKWRSVIQFLIVTALGPSSFAGGWSSGGGELLKDSVNPWFLNNTPKVTYCILIDENNFGATRATAEIKVASAIHYWQDQFKFAILVNLPKFGQLRIASQIFQKTDCHSDTDIVFQFGVLTAKQKVYLRHPKEYGAISVRTGYDEVTLKGNGFVYVSPSSGPLAYDAVGVVKNAWAIDDGRLLFLTLLHEMGHVFGLQHSGSYGDLMSEGFVEAILTSGATPSLASASDHKFFALPSDTKVICPGEALLTRWKEFFGPKASFNCLQFTFEHDPRNMLLGQTTMRVYAYDDPRGSKTRIHEINLSVNRFFPSFTSLIWLPKNQAVFDPSDIKSLGTTNLLGINFLQIGKQGTFLLPDGITKRSISVHFEQGKQQFFMDGVVDSEIVPIL